MAWRASDAWYGCPNPGQSETGHSWQSGNFDCTWPPLTSDPPLVNSRKVYLQRFPYFSDSAIAEGKITPCNHDVGPETIVHPLPLRVGGPCSLVTSSPPNPSSTPFLGFGAFQLLLEAFASGGRGGGWGGEETWERF